MALFGRLLFIPIFGSDFAAAYPMFLILLISAVSHGVLRTHSTFLSGQGF